MHLSMSPPLARGSQSLHFKGRTGLIWTGLDWTGSVKLLPVGLELDVLFKGSGEWKGTEETVLRRIENFNIFCHEL